MNNGPQKTWNQASQTKT